MTVPLISKHARDLGASPSLVGLVGSIYGAMQLFASPLVGKWSDISGRRTVLLWCLLLSAVGYAILGLSTTILLLFLARIPPGIFKHTQELTRGVITDSVPKSEQAKTYGQLNSISQMGFIFGPLVGGHITELENGFHICAFVTSSIFITIYGLFKHTGAIIKAIFANSVSPESRPGIQGRYNAISNLGFVFGPTIGGHFADAKDGFMLVAMASSLIFILNSALVWWLAPPDDGKNKVEKENAKEKDNGFNPLSFMTSFRDIDWKNLWDVFLVRFLCGFAVIVYRSNFSMMLSYKYEASAKITGYITSYTAIVGTVAGFFVGKISNYYKDDTTLLFHTAIAQFLSLLALTFSPSLELLVLSLAPLGIANSVARVTSTNLTIDRGHGQEIGALLGLGASTLSVARMLAPVLGGVAQEFYLSGPALVGTVSAAGGALVLGLFSIKYSKKAKTS